MAQGRSTEVISMLEWIRTSRLSINNYVSMGRLNKPDGMPGMPGLVVDLSGRRFVKTNTVHGVEVP